MKLLSLIGRLWHWFYFYPWGEGAMIVMVVIGVVAWSTILGIVAPWLSDFLYYNDWQPR